MGDEKKVKKTKKKKEEGEPAAAAPAEAASPAAPPPPQAEDAPKRASAKEKKAKRSGSQMFSNKQMSDFKEAFSLMDADKDGVIMKNDLRQTMDQLGQNLDDREADKILSEANGPLNFTALLAMFAAKMAGGADDESQVVGAFKKFDDDGKIDSEKLRHALMTWGDKFSAAECDECFDLMKMDASGKIDTMKLIEMITGGAGDEEEEEAA